MATWSTTKAKLQQRIENLVRRMTGQEGLSYLDKQTINDGINLCLVDLCTDRGIGMLNAIVADTSATTTASTNYVDLSSDVVQVIDGTVRISAQDQFLTRMSLQDFYAIDVGEDTTGRPSHYALGNNGTVIRMYFRNTPDAAYTVAFQARTIVDEDSISSFPNWVHALILAGSIANALELLGLDSGIYRARYEDRLKNFKAVQTGHMGPVHVRPRTRRSFYRHPELRRPD